MKIIKRYTYNRKYYLAELSRYISLEEIGEMVLKGEQIKVIDQTTKNDITGDVYVSLIIMRAKNLSSMRDIADLTEMFHKVA